MMWQGSIGFRRLVSQALKKMGGLGITRVE
jgi:hypothetical protein